MRELQYLWDEIVDIDQEDLYEIIYIDPLTKIHNRKAFELTSYNNIVLVDLDGLKYINDEFGHRAGDSQLIKLATFLDKTTNWSAFRVAGDEFALTFNSNENVDFSYELLNNYRNQVWDSYSFGIGKTLEEADDKLIMDKNGRLACGRRVKRGEMPPWFKKEVQEKMNF